MQKSKIEWCDYTINPVKGLCPMDCKDNSGKSYCYARRMYKRFKWNPIIRYDDWCWQEGSYIPKGSKVFVGSTIELFGSWIEPIWLETVFDYCRACPSVNFIFLTKKPQNLQKWSPFPDNCWIGASAENLIQFAARNEQLRLIEAKVKFISLEPLLDWELGQLKNTSFHWKQPSINWLIIGQQTPISKKTQPKIEWIKEIVNATDKAKIPVFLKNNLYKTLIYNGNDGAELPDWAENNRGSGKLRQEFPK